MRLLPEDERVSVGVGGGEDDGAALGKEGRFLIPSNLQRKVNANKQLYQIFIFSSTMITNSKEI